MDELEKISLDEYLNVFDDTSKLAAKNNAIILGDGIAAYYQSEALANNVEFWKWLDRNYAQSGIFSSNQSMQNYSNLSASKEEWFAKQLQGKGFEWDWMTQQRRSIQNIFNKYDAGDIVNRAASDVTETNLLTGNSTEYQMKAYTSASNPDLKNTPKDMAVVTNAEKVDIVKQNGYETVEQFQDNNTIKEQVDKRLEQVKNGSASPQYTFGKVCFTMARAGIIGCAIGMTIESVTQYKNWKKGYISDKEYLITVLKAGGDSGITATATAGIMIPVEAAVTAAGLSCPITIPISIVIGMGVNKVVAPCFGRGDYAKYLGQAKYYSNLNYMYKDMVVMMEQSTDVYLKFENEMKEQFAKYYINREKGISLNNEIDTILNRL